MTFSIISIADGKAITIVTNIGPQAAQTIVRVLQRLVENRKYELKPNLN